jgi:hypothetical protein
VKYQGIALTAFFLCATVAYSTIFFLEDPAKHGFKGEHSVAVVGGMGIAVFGSMLLMSLYVWAAYYVERFSINGTLLGIRSMCQRVELDVTELQSLKWKAIPMGGKIVFRFMGGKARLDFHGYSEENRLRIIRSLRMLVSHDIQEGWPQFCHKVALPLRDGKRPVPPGEPASDVVIVTRQRYNRMLAITFPVSIAVAIALSVWLGFWYFLIVPCAVVAGWLLLRLGVPPEGLAVPRLSSTCRGTAQRIGLGAAAGTYILMIGLPLLGVERTLACWSACVVLGVAIPPMFYFLHKADKERRAADEEAAQLAPAKWETGEQEA